MVICMQFSVWVGSASVLYAKLHLLLGFVFFDLLYLCWDPSCVCTHWPRSPGYGLTLVSESTTGVTHAADLSSVSDYLPSIMTTAVPSPVGTGRRTLLPEDIGRNTALALVEKIVQVNVIRTGVINDGSTVCTYVLCFLCCKIRYHVCISCGWV